MNFKTICLTLLAAAGLQTAEAKSVTLETGKWILDRSRTVEIDQFDYIYTVKSIQLGGYYIELEDGSVWRVEELGPEAASFYRLYQNTKIDFVENIVADWQPGERLIFHKVIDRESLLIYNLDRDQLFDVTPLSPPKENYLKLESIDFSVGIIKLSDGSSWKGKICSCKGWKSGNPILVVKNTPWDQYNTHMLVNLKYCECTATSGHIHPDRCGVLKFY